MRRSSPLKNKKVLITCGPTWIPIDEVRVLSNQSSGELGRILAEKFSETGARVTVLAGPISERLDSTRVRVKRFQFYDELSALLTKEVKRKYDVVIHAAAVADFRLKNPLKGKIDSQGSTLTLRLVPTKKIINDIKKWSPGTFLIGFKLKQDLRVSDPKIHTLFTQARCDALVINTLRKATYRGLILDSQKNILGKASSRFQMARQLLRVVERKFIERLSL